MSSFRGWMIRPGSFAASRRDFQLNEPRGLFAFNQTEDRFDTIAWSYRDKAWVVNGSVLSNVIGDDRDAEETTRAGAEQLAIRLGFSQLPTEEEFMRIS